MNPAISPLDHPASVRALRRLLAAGQLTPEDEGGLESQVRGQLPWRIWLDRGLLCLGVTLILAGIGYFFAHNWRQITDAEKLDLAGGAVFVSFASASWAGFDRFLGKVLLLAASALVGVFIAVFGQVYQTGADTYELFTAWAFLIFPWVALGRFMPLWILWIAVLNFAAGFYWVARPEAFLFLDWDQFRSGTVSLVLINGAALLLRELVRLRSPEWFDRGWSRLILLAGIVIPASLETITEILRTWDSSTGNTAAIVALASDTALCVGLGYYFSRLRYSLPALAMITLGACTTLTFLAARIVNIDHPDNAGALLFLGLIVLAIFGAGVFFLRTQRLAHQTTS
jgi:uncharacterized membrane protein